MGRQGTRKAVVSCAAEKVWKVNRGTAPLRKGETMTTRYYRQDGGSYGCRGAYTVHHLVVDGDQVIAYASTHGFHHPATADEAARLGKANSGYYREPGHPRQAECEAALIAEAESGHGGWTLID